MKISDLNQHMKLPAGAKLRQARVSDCWFVVIYDHEGWQHKVHYNQDGREVFSVSTRHRTFWDKLWLILKGTYADTDS